MEMSARLKSPSSLEAEPFSEELFFWRRYVFSVLLWAGSYRRVPLSLASLRLKVHHFSFEVAVCL